jgi:hypothetical protein
MAVLSGYHLCACRPVHLFLLRPSRDELHQDCPHRHQTEGYPGSGNIGSNRAVSCLDGARMATATSWHSDLGNSLLDFRGKRLLRLIPAACGLPPKRPSSAAETQTMPWTRRPSASGSITRPVGNGLLQFDYMSRISIFSLHGRLSGIPHASNFLAVLRPSRAADGPGPCNRLAPPVG